MTHLSWLITSYSFKIMKIRTFYSTLKEFSAVFEPLLSILPSSLIKRVTFTPHPPNNYHFLPFQSKTVTHFYQSWWSILSVFELRFFLSKTNCFNYEHGNGTRGAIFNFKCPRFGVWYLHAFSCILSSISTTINGLFLINNILYRYC